MYNKWLWQNLRLGGLLLNSNRLIVRKLLQLFHVPEYSAFAWIGLVLRTKNRVLTCKSCFKTGFDWESAKFAMNIQYVRMIRTCFLPLMLICVFDKQSQDVFATMNIQYQYHAQDSRPMQMHWSWMIGYHIWLCRPKETAGHVMIVITAKMLRDAIVWTYRKSFDSKFIHPSHTNLKEHKLCQSQEECCRIKKKTRHSPEDFDSGCAPY